MLRSLCGKIPLRISCKTAHSLILLCLFNRLPWKVLSSFSSKSTRSLTCPIKMEISGLCLSGDSANAGRRLCLSAVLLWCTALYKPHEPSEAYQGLFIARKARKSCRCYYSICTHNSLVFMHLCCETHWNAHLCFWGNLNVRLCQHLFKLELSSVKGTTQSLWKLCLCSATGSLYQQRNKCLEPSWFSQCLLTALCHCIIWPVHVWWKNFLCAMQTGPHFCYN